MSLKILYRGFLSDCNYRCHYCPFAHTVHSTEEQDTDRQAVIQFVSWIIQNSTQDFELFFTPYGEALTRAWYREAIATLSYLPHVKKVAIQTNLSCNTEWFSTCNPSTTAVWATFHPEFTYAESFAKQCKEVINLNIALSAGSVGVKNHFAEIQMLRERLPDSVYLWINAFKHESDYYSHDDRDFLSNIDPYFSDNLHAYESHDKQCRTGHSVVSVEGNGDLFRCHFVKEKRGNIFTDSLESLLYESTCPKETCHCHIGYVHLEHLNLQQLYGNGILERIPENFHYQRTIT